MKSLLKKGNFVQNSFMRRLFLFIIPAVLFSCGGSNSEEGVGEDQLPVNSKFADGKEVYDQNCIACHMEDGMGLEGVFPPLANSDYLLADPIRALKQVKNGSDEEMVVNGVTYDEVMPAQNVSDEELIDVVNYILNAWGNDGGEVTLEDLEKIK